MRPSGSAPQVRYLGRRRDMYHYVIPRCPLCQRALDFHTFGVCSGLGPPAIRCGCGQVVATNRLEWGQMRALRRTRFVLVSLLHATAMGYLGGVSVRGAFHFIENGPWEESMKLGGPGFVSGAIAWAASVIVVQAWRVVASCRRSGQRKEPPLASRWALDFGTQLKAMFVVWIPVLAGWLISVVSHG
jgi:hypothetical protein